MGDLLVYPKKGDVFGKLVTCSGIQVFVAGLGLYPTFCLCFEVSVAVPEEFCLSESDFTVCFTGRWFPVSFTLCIYSRDSEVSWDVVWDGAPAVALRQRVVFRVLGLPLCLLKGLEGCSSGQVEPGCC